MDGRAEARMNMGCTRPAVGSRLERRVRRLCAHGGAGLFATVLARSLSLSIAKQRGCMTLLDDPVCVSIWQWLGTTLGSVFMHFQELALEFVRLGYWHHGFDGVQI